MVFTFHKEHFLSRRASPQHDVFPICKFMKDGHSTNYSILQTILHIILLIILQKLYTFYVNWIVYKLEVGIHITIFFWRGCNSEMAPLCSCHALMAGIWTSKLTKIVNEIWLTETFWGIESFKIFKDVGNEEWWLNTMSQVSISTVYSPPPSTFTLLS